MARILIEGVSTKINEAKPKQIVGPANLEAFRAVLQREGMPESLAGYVEDMIEAINNRGQIPGPTTYLNQLKDELNKYVKDNSKKATGVELARRAAINILSLANSNDRHDKRASHESAKQQ